MSKEFQKKYMHPTRRKLVDMIKTGQYQTDTKVGWTGNKVERKVGDVWEDDYNRYEKKQGYILKTSKNHDAFQNARDYINQLKQCKNPECKKVRKNHNDKKIIEKTGFCIDCLSEREHNFRVAGLWKEYEDYRIYTRMLIEGKIKLDSLKQSLSEVKQVYEYVNENGTTDKWELPKPVEEVKAEIQEIIDNGLLEIQEVEKRRNEAFEIIRKNNLEHYL